MEGQNRKEEIKKKEGKAIALMPLAAQHWLGPLYQPLVKMGGEPYRQPYVDWSDQGQLKSPGLEEFLQALV